MFMSLICSRSSIANNTTTIMKPLWCFPVEESFIPMMKKAFQNCPILFADIVWIFLARKHFDFH